MDVIHEAKYYRIIRYPAQGTMTDQLTLAAIQEKTFTIISQDKRLLTTDAKYRMHYIRIRGEHFNTLLFNCMSFSS